MIINIGAILLLAIFLNGTLGEWGGDNVDYLLLAEAIATGQGYYDIHLAAAPAHVHYPPLYPLLLAPLVAFDLPMVYLKVWTALFSILGLNAAYFYLNESLGRRLAFLITAATACCGAFLDSGYSVMSEGPYLLLSLLALFYIRRSFKDRRYWAALAAGAGLLVGLAVLVRTIGVCMGPAVTCFAFLGHFPTFTRRQKVQRWLLVGLLSALVVGSWVYVFSPRAKKGAEKTYGLQFDKAVEKESLAERPWTNVTDFAERLATTPMPEALKTFGRVGKRTVLGLFLGLCALSTLMVVAGFLRRVIYARDIHDFYVLFYILILLLWIPGGFRLVMPILPFLFWYAYEGFELAVERIRRLRRAETPAVPLVRPSRPAVVMMAVLIAANLLVTLEFPLIRDRLNGKFKPWWHDYMQAVCELGSQTPPGTIVISMPDAVPYYLAGLKNTRIPNAIRKPDVMLNVLLTSKAEYIITTPFQQARFGNVLVSVIEKNPQNFVEVGRYGKTRIVRVEREEEIDPFAAPPAAPSTPVAPPPKPVPAPLVKRPLTARCLTYLQQ